MTRLLLKLPWFLSTPAILVLTVALLFGTQHYLGTYFVRTFLNEADPLAGVAEARNATPIGAAISTRQTEGAAPTVAASAKTAVPSTGTASTAAPAATVVAPTVVAPPAAASPAILARGVFRDGDPGHNGSGIAKIIRAADGSLVLRFEDFSVTNGPDVFVILSSDPNGDRSSAGSGLNLGGLRATDGNINYAIPAGTDVSPFRSVIVYCRQFNVVMARATLEV